MLRRTPFLVAALLLCAPVVLAEEEPREAREAIPAVYASEEVAEQALDVFKDEYKARGLKGEEKVAQRVWAMKRLAQTQHKEVADKLIKLMRDRDPDIKTAAVQYLGLQRSLPGYAGQAVFKAMDKNKSDSVFLIAGLQAIRDLEYRGGAEQLRELMRHKDYAVQKSAMFAIGDLKDMRLLDDVVALIAKIKKSKGESWEGVSVSVDTGTAGDGDQREAERLGKEKMAKNKRKGRRAGRSKRDLGPVVEEVLKTLTGEEFASGKQVDEWKTAQAEEIARAQAALDDEQEAQDEAADDL